MQLHNWNEKLTTVLSCVIQSSNIQLMRMRFTKLTSYQQQINLQEDRQFSVNELF